MNQVSRDNSRLSSSIDFQLLNEFDAVRKTLLASEFDQQRKKPLGYWAKSSDRRLPMAFLPHTIEQLLATPFPQLQDTAGVGVKKMRSLVTLLTRAASDTFEPDSQRTGIVGVADDTTPEAGEFNSATVSEALWQQWRETVRKHDLGGLPLGRLAPSLLDLPTVIWETPLAFYLERNLADMRDLKAYGEKRVHDVLRVFFYLHRSLQHVPVAQHLAIQPTLRPIQEIEAYINKVAAGGEVPSESELRQHLAGPLMAQLAVDVGQTTADLMSARLGLSGPVTGVQQLAKSRNVTRARVYQVLDECTRAVQVRWPQGRISLRLLEELCGPSEFEDGAGSFAMARNLREVLFPTKGAKTELAHRNGSSLTASPGSSSSIPDSSLPGQSSQP